MLTLPRRRIRERIGIVAPVRFLVYDHELERVVRDEVVYNKVVDVWLNVLRDSARGLESDLTYRQLAWGNNATAPAGGDTALGNELARKDVTLKTAGAAGIVTATTHVAQGEANTQLEEWGLFGGPVGDLTMVARVLWSHDKNDGESIQVDWQHTFQEVV